MKKSNTRDGQDLAALLLQKLGLLGPHAENEGHIESGNDAHDEGRDTRGG